jgi:hypothetical protein
MNRRAGALCLAIALGACTGSTEPAEPAEPAAVAPASSPVAVDEAGQEIMAVAVIAPTPAMLKAALADDPAAMRDAAVALAGCQAATTCPSQYASCSSWSAPALCAQACNLGACICRPIGSPECEGEVPEPKGSESYNAFRVCFNSSGQSCTEWTKSTYTVCGC